MINLITYFLSALCVGAFTARTAVRKKQHPAATSYVGLGILIAVSYFSFGGHLLTGNMWLKRIFFLSLALLPPALLHFVKNWQVPQLNTSGFWKLSFLFGASFITVDLLGVIKTHRASFFETGILSWLFCGSCYCAWTIWTRSADSEAATITKTRLKQFLALFTLTIVTLTLEGIWRGIPFKPIEEMSFIERSQVLQGQLPPLGALMSILLMYVLYLNMKYTRLVGMNELFARMSATAISAFALSSLIAVTVSIDREYALHAAFQILCVAILFLSMYSVIQEPIQRQMSKIFNRYGSQLNQAMKIIEMRLPGVLNLDNFEEIVVQGIHDSGRTKMIGLYLWDHEKGLFELKSVYGEHPNQRPIGAIAREPILEAFESYGYLDNDPVIDHEESNNGYKRLLHQMGADLCLPMWMDSVLMGWICFSTDQITGGFSKEEISSLKRIVDRATMTLEMIRSINRIHEQRRLASLGTMAAGLAHEIRNPLAGIKGAAQHLQGNPSALELEDFLSLIVSEADRLNVVVSQFLDYSRPLKLNKEMDSINGLLRKSADLLLADPENEQIALDLKLFEGLTPMKVDPNALSQVFLNLLQNASQATDRKGKVVISTRLGRCIDPPHQGQPAVVIEISDDGIGIPEFQRDKIFVPFFTSKPDGTGLGLPISHRLIEAHDGKLSLKASSKSGSIFQIRLPILFSDRPKGIN